MQAEFWVGLVAVGVLTAVVSTASGMVAEPPRQLGGVPVPGFEVTRLEPKPFASLHAAVAPRGTGERWTEIPWEPDLNRARERAAREGKPLLIWVMDGHPLGCT
jgi:hypothetical protein